MIDGFINQLPKEYKINVIIPPQSIIGHEPPKVYPPVEDQIYEGSIETIIGTPPSSH
jgi:hypothetical protein